MSAVQGQGPTVEELREWADFRERPGEPPLIALLRLARVGVEALAAQVPSLEVVDRNSYDFIESRLEQIASFETFSLAEYTFRRADGGRPGLRFWLVNGGDRPRVELVYFEDVEQWRVDFEGEKLSETLLVLGIGDQTLALVGGTLAEGSRSTTPWSMAVLEALKFPVEL